MRRVLTLALVAIAATACGESQEASSVSFGDQDTTCASVELAGDAEDFAPLQAGIQCLLSEFEAGNPVVVDFSLGTVEGDQIYTRYDYDGTEVLIVSDDRLDEFGSGSVAAAVCQGLVNNPGNVPDGEECEAVAHDGFTNADN